MMSGVLAEETDNGGLDVDGLHLVPSSANEQDQQIAAKRLSIPLDAFASLLQRFVLPA